MPLLMCPNDDSPMQTMDRSGVQFDMCPTCRGVWLDRGELEKLMDAAAQDARASVPVSASAPAPAPHIPTHQPAPVHHAPVHHAPAPQYPPQPYGHHPQSSRDHKYDRDGHRYDKGYDKDGYRKRKKRDSIFDIFDFD